MCQRGWGEGKRERERILGRATPGAQSHVPEIKSRAGCSTDLATGVPTTIFFFLSN